MKKGEWALVCIFVSLFLFGIGFVDAKAVSLSHQGNNLRNISSGTLLQDGTLTIIIYDNLTDGNLIYNETFNSVINDGSWNVMLGEDPNKILNLEFGKIYYQEIYVNWEKFNFTDYENNSVERKFFYSPLGDIGNEDLNITNLTLTSLNVTGVTNLGNITIDADNITVNNILPKDNGEIKVWGNLTSSWGFFNFLGSLTNRIAGLFVQDVNIGGNLNVSGNMTLNGTTISDWSEISGLTNSFGGIVGFTSGTYDGNITNGSLIGYVGANKICEIEFPESHFCLKSEVLKSISNGNYFWSGTAWFQNGPPGYTANADDCSGWTTDSNIYLGPFWNWDANSQAGRAALINCAQIKALMCCGGNA